MTCSLAIITNYQKRTSGPLLDRIDIHIEVPRVDYEKLSDQRLGEPSEVIQIRVEAAHQVQRERFAVGAKQSNQSEKPNQMNASPCLQTQCNAEMRPAVQVLRAE